ncbi:MAG: glycosyltransferase family 4 protein [Parcubacteria group bacterium]
MISSFGARDTAFGKKGAFYNTLEELHKHWDRIDVIAPGSKWWFKKATCAKLFGSFNTVHIHTSSWPLWLHPFWIKSKGKELIKQHKHDIATVHDFPPFYNGMGAKMLHKATGIPYLLEIFHIAGYPRPANNKEKRYRDLMKRGIAHDAEHAVAVRVMNKVQVPEFLIDAGVPKEKLKYISAIYIDLEVFKPMSVVKKYDVIAIARLAGNKGLILLLDAIVRIKKDKPNVKAVIVGTGPLQKKLEREVNELGLKDNLIFAGWVDVDKEVKLINESRMLGMTSYTEGGPGVTIEAMACGVPVITTKVGIMVDIIKDGENGLFIDWTSEDIAEKISKLLEDGDMQEKFSKQGLEIVKQFEKKQAIKNYADELKKLIKE